MPQRSPLLPIFLIVLVDIFGFTLVIPLLSIYAETFRASPLQATLLVSVYAACQLVSGPILGRVSDRIGRKPMLLVSQVGTLIGFIILARASALWMLYLGRIIDGATAGNLSLAQAYISDNTAPSERAKSFALIGIAFGVGFFFGPLVTGSLVAYGIRAPVYAAAGLSATSILCTFFLLPGGRAARAPGADEAATADKPTTLAAGAYVPYREGEATAEANAPPETKRLGILSWSAYAPFFTRPVLGGLLAQFFFFTFCFSTFNSGFALFAERTFTVGGHAFGPREIGYLFAYAGFLGIILQGGFIGRLVKRYGEGALVAMGFATLVVGYAALGAIHTLSPLVLVTTIASFGNGVLRPALTSLITQRAGRHEQGTVLGVTQSLNAVATMFAPLLAGALIERGALPAWAWVAAIVAAMGLIAARWGSSLAKPVAAGQGNHATGLRRRSPRST